MSVWAIIAGIVVLLLVLVLVIGKRGVHRVKKMNLVHYSLLVRSNAQLRDLAAQAAASGSCEMEVFDAEGDIRELTDGMSIRTDRTHTVNVDKGLLDWAVAVTDLMDRATAAGGGMFQDPQTELKLWKQAYKMAPAYPLIPMSLGVTYAEAGKVKPGIKYLEEALYLAPHSERIRDNLEAIRDLR